MKRADVVADRRKRRQRHLSAAPAVSATRPNDVWSIEFKGWLRVGGTRRVKRTPDPRPCSFRSSRAGHHAAVANWSDVFLHATAAAAVIDCVVHHATVLKSDDLGCGNCF